MALDRMGQKSADRIIQNIDASRNQPCREYSMDWGFLLWANGPRQFWQTRSAV